MTTLEFGIFVTLAGAAGLVAGLLLRARAYQWLHRRRQARERHRLFEETDRQIALERLNARRELYLGFRRAAVDLVEDLAAGGGRWSSFYLVRDTLAAINATAGPDVALAARQMCFVCQVMLNDGFSDALSVRFNKALQRFEEACRADPAGESRDTSCPVEGSRRERLARMPEARHRRVYRVLR